jgi:4-amino-4-deoxy-L-arabinose transferase-like glycosyltransferase
MRAATIGEHSRSASASPAVSADARVVVTTLAVVGIVCLAAGLRLASLDAVPNNLFYDAAVRSMSQGWHNFFYAAFEPGGGVAVDKPPIDLWLQVASVKLLGFNSFALKLPEALAGTAAVPIMYDVVRRLFGTGAGLVSALCLAILPITVLTSRSDTMDTLMMMLILVAAWLVVRAAETGRARFLYLAAAVIAIDFNVKLFEALLPVPALLVLYLVAARMPARRQLGRGGVAALVFATVALAWPIAVSVAPDSHKPYPLGSTNGSVWSSIFVFDGLNRAGSAPRAGHRRRERHAAPPPSAKRLFSASPIALDRQVGSELLPAIALGGLALALGLWGGSAPTSLRRAWHRRDRSAYAGALALALWLLAGTIWFSAMARLHPRYLEALSPAIAATLGVGLVTFAKASIERRWARLALFPVFGLCVIYATHLAAHQSGLRAFILCSATLASLCLLLSVVETPRAISNGGRARLVTAISILVLLPLLAAPASESLAIVRHHKSDSTTALARSPHRLARLRRYLIAHQGGARYEVATRNAWQAAPLIVADGRPVLISRNVDGRALVSSKRLREKVREGEVKYVWLGRRCSLPRARRFTACQPLGRWVRRHGTRVTKVDRQAGLWRVRVRSRG